MPATHDGGVTRAFHVRAHGQLPRRTAQIREGDKRTALSRGHAKSLTVLRAGLARDHGNEHRGGMKLRLRPFLDDFPHGLLHRAALQPCARGDVGVALIAELDAFDVMSKWEAHVTGTFVEVYGRGGTRFFEARRVGAPTHSADRRDEPEGAVRPGITGAGRPRYSFGSNFSFPAVIAESCQARNAGTRSPQDVRDAFVIPSARAIALFVPKWRTASSVLIRHKIKHAIPHSQACQTFTARDYTPWTANA